MDPFAVIMTVIVGGLLLWIIFLGIYHPRSGADVLQWRPTRSPELEIQNEIDDVEQMLEAANERRRARGEDELTEEAMQARVNADLREANERRERYLDNADLRQMLTLANERRRRRGEPEVSEAEYRSQVEADRSQLARPPDESG
jgi:hypothetical protein